VRRRRRDNTEPRGLGWYLFYALVLHFLFFGLAAFNRYLGDLNPLKELPIDMEIATDQPPKQSGGKQEEKDEPPPPPKQAKVVPQVPIEPTPVVPPVPEITKDLQAIETKEPVPTAAMVVPKQLPKVEPPKDVQKEQVVSTMDVKTVMQGLTGRGSGSDFGSGAGRGSGNGGLGRGFGINDKELPVVQGGAVFGTSKKGFLKGSICFLPPGTQLLKNISRCPPIGIMYANVLNVAPQRFTHGFPGVSDRFEWFMLDFKGKFNVENDGDYEFRLLSDDGSILWIDNMSTPVIDNDGQHPPQAKIKSYHLTAGKHSMRVLYYQGPRTQVALQLFVKPPGGVEKLFNGSL
jgi:hypothetical protein